MIFDQSKVASYNRGIGFDAHDYFTKHQPVVLNITDKAEIFDKI